VTEIDAALVRRKLARIKGNLERLAAVESLSLEAYRAAPLTPKATERLLQETVDAAVDVNLHLLRAGAGEPPPDYYESFVRLGKAGVIPDELARELAPSTGLRNRIVHEYDELDDEIILAAVSHARGGFARYIEAVERHLAALGV
jgi:uncharacterized protein YutE (UPF0331/DUF86 family)